MNIATTTQMATILWIREIQIRLRGIGVGAIEQWVLKKEGRIKEDFWQNYSKRFCQYRKGWRSPGKRYQAQLEKLLPGSSKIFTHPLWWILDRPLANQADIDKHLTMLEPCVYRRLFRHSKRSGIAERRSIRGINYVCNIGREDSVDALAALLMLIREAELKQDPATYNNAKWEVLDLLSRLATYKPFQKIAEPLNELIDARFTRRTAPYPEMPALTEDAPEQIQFPRHKLDIADESMKNGQQILHGLMLGFLPYDEKAQRNYLFLSQKLNRLRTFLDSLNPQLELFPKNPGNSSSRPVTPKRNAWSAKNSAGGQFNWNMQMHALARFAVSA